MAGEIAGPVLALAIEVIDGLFEDDGSLAAGVFAVGAGVGNADHGDVGLLCGGIALGDDEAAGRGALASPHLDAVVGDAEADDEAEGGAEPAGGCSRIGIVEDGDDGAGWGGTIGHGDPRRQDTARVANSGFLAGGTDRKAKATAKAKNRSRFPRGMTKRKAGTVWLEWFPGLKIETWGTRCVGVSAKSKDNCRSRFPRGMTERKATATARKAEAKAKTKARATGGQAMAGASVVKGWVQGWTQLRPERLAQ